ncbi:hypothetical protein HDU76_001308 [Blyttiomyces sp. JEL0837]|nr:hypothetical protein HDU76_001308 [Blyttiomyces sp. JEL0837]
MDDNTSNAEEEDADLSNMTAEQLKEEVAKLEKEYCKVIKGFVAEISTLRSEEDAAMVKLQETRAHLVACKDSMRLADSAPEPIEKQISKIVKSPKPEVAAQNGISVEDKEQVLPTPAQSDSLVTAVVVGANLHASQSQIDLLDKSTNDAEVEDDLIAKIVTRPNTEATAQNVSSVDDVTPVSLSCNC